MSSEIKTNQTLCHWWKSQIGNSSASPKGLQAKSVTVIEQDHTGFTESTTYIGCQVQQILNNINPVHTRTIIIEL